MSYLVGYRDGLKGVLSRKFGWERVVVRWKVEGKWNGRSVGWFSTAFGAKKTKVPKEKGRGEWGGAEKTVRLSVICGEGSGSPTVRDYLGQN